MSPQETYADKINKLLAKAESTTPEEAELLYAKAQELMTKYAITQALLDQQKGIVRDEIAQHDFKYGGYYAADRGNLAYTVARHNGLRAVYHRSTDWTGAREINGKTYRMWYILTGIGFQSDLDRAVMLDASLQLQMMQALTAEWKKEDRSWMSKTQNVRWRQSFMAGFAAGVGRKLAEANRIAQEEVIREGTGDKDSVALVLRSRKDRVDDWMDQHYGKLRAGRSSYKQQDYNARSAGQSAGGRADIGSGKLGNRKGLNK